VVDARALELAIVNLIDNALKYAKGTEAVDVQVTANGAGGAIVRVSDGGPGIEPEDQSRIFDRFVRGRIAHEMHIRGSGIGLALVKHIAESHGGKVSVASPVRDDGRGTTFELELPAKPPGHARAEA
jgi:two-component system phosphate regulon sensor histidine kinase PhoR